jgi:hypothetical protein
VGIGSGLSGEKRSIRPSRRLRLGNSLNFPPARAWELASANGGDGGVRSAPAEPSAQTTSFRSNLRLKTFQKYGVMGLLCLYTKIDER